MRTSLTLLGLIGTAGVTWFVVSLGGTCMDGIQTNCNSSWRPVTAAFAVSVGAIVALVLDSRGSRHAAVALAAAFAWSVLMVGLMDAVYLAESGYSRLLDGPPLLLPLNLVMFAPALLYLGAAFAQPGSAGRVHGQPGGRQAHGEEAADSLIEDRPGDDYDSWAAAHQK
jgi:hypothetical protein